MKKILFTGARSGIINKVINKLIFDYEIYLTVHTYEQLKIVRRKYRNFKNVKCFKLDIDVLVCNAAIGESGSMAEIDMDKVRDNFETNVFCNFELVQIVLSSMIKKGSGRIIMVSSLAGKIPIPFLGPYCASKASINKLAEALALELKLLDVNIEVSLVMPGLYNTGFNRLMLDKKYDQMEIESYFKEQIDLIRVSENVVLKLFEKKKINSIVNKIVKAINDEKSHFIYSAPLFQKLLANFYAFFR